MKRLVTFALVLALVGCQSSKKAKTEAAPAAECDVGPPACYPDLDMTNLEGAVFTKDAMRGKVIIVNFWATWCKPCLKEIPALSKYYAEHKEKGLEIIGVLNEDGVSQEVLERFKKRTGMSFPLVVFDDAVLSAWNYPDRLPTTFIYDRSGRLETQKIGAISEAELDEIIGKLLAEKPPADKPSAAPAK